MSTDYYFEIDIVRRGKSELSSVDIIKGLICAKWSLFSEKDMIIFTDIGDNDDFNFLSKPMTKEEYYNVVNQKQKKGELISFAMFRVENNCRYRIDIMITSKFKVLISPDDLTKRMLSYDLNLLDVNWYLCRTIPYLKSEKMLIESFSFSQC